MVKNPGTAFNTTRLWIRGPVIDARDPSMSDGRRAHGARFQRHIEIISRKPLLSQGPTRRAYDIHLGVGGWISIRACAVPILGNDDALGGHKHRTDRNFTPLTCGSCLAQRYVHKGFKQDRPRIHCFHMMRIWSNRSSWHKKPQKAIVSQKSLPELVSPAAARLSA